MFAGMLNSFVLDYVARQKIGGMNLNFFISKQLPVIRRPMAVMPSNWSPSFRNTDWLCSRVLELTFTSWSIESFVPREARRPWLEKKIEETALCGVEANHLSLPVDRSKTWISGDAHTPSPTAIYPPQGLNPNALRGRPCRELNLTCRLGRVSTAHEPESQPIPL